MNHYLLVLGYTGESKLVRFYFAEELAALLQNEKYYNSYCIYEVVGQSFPQPKPTKNFLTVAKEAMQGVRRYK